METVKLHIQMRKPGGMLLFAKHICGLPIEEHRGQVRWLTNSTHRINILRPGNKWGKSLVGGIKHLYHAYLKWNMWGMYRTYQEWEQIKYDTLNFGPGYEQAREIPRMARDIAEGNVFLPPQFQERWGSTNRSLLKDWFITNDKVDAINMPYLGFSNGSRLLIRSYDEMGAAFKMKGIAYVSGDEVADINELWAFTNGTLLPRGVAYRNFSIDYYGTPQPDGFDYIRMIEMAEDEMKREDWKDSGMWYVQRGSMFENPFLNRETVEAIEKISDPEMRRQIIGGEYVDSGTKYFGFDRIQNAVDSTIVQSKALPGRRYVVSCDFAGGESATADFTVIMVIDCTDEPYKVVRLERFKGGDVPIPMQYKLVEDIFLGFKNDALECRLVIDSSALGGMNAKAFLRHLNPITYSVNPTLKAEMLATLKISLDGGQSDKFKRNLEVQSDGTSVERTKPWGLIRIPNFPPLITELQNYKVNDAKIRTDCVMTLAQGIHYIEMKRPKKIKNKMVNFDVLTI